MQFKLTLALTLSALAAAVPTEYRHDVRGHAAASVIEAGRAIGDAPNAVINGVTNNIIDPVENAAIATAEKAVHAKNVAANAAAQTYNVAAETAYNAKAKTVNTAIDARDTIYETAENAKDGAKHLAYQTEQTTPVQAAEASGHWFISKFNNAWALVNGAIARRTGRAAARAEESAEYHENALTQNQAQMRENVEAQKAHLAHLKERADIHAANARAKVEENVIEPAVEIKEDVSARTSSTMESIKESAQAKFNTVKNSLRQFGPNPATSVDLGTVKGTYTRYDVNGKLIDEIIETPTLIKEDITVIGEPIAQQVVVPNQVVESSAASLSLIAAAVLVSVQLLI